MIHLRAIFRLTQFAGEGGLFDPFQAVGLRLAAALRQCFGKVGKQHGKPQPQADRAGKEGIARQVSGAHGDG
ncbi:hypothetical protein D3C87_1805370 [compost metagenome]